MHVEIVDRQRRHRGVAAGLAAFLRRVAREAPKTRGDEVSVLLCGDARMRRLNARYRRKDRTTDVLSFGSDGSPRADGRRPLGDIVISVDQSRGHRPSEERKGLTRGSRGAHRLPPTVDC